MTCFDCCKEIAAYPCACGYQPRGLALRESWLIQHCSRPGCCTAIRVKNGRQEVTPVCKWCRDDQQTPKLAIVVDTPRRTAKEGFTAIAQSLPSSLRR
jgi:hypothetical protein